MEEKKGTRPDTSNGSGSEGGIRGGRRGMEELWKERGAKGEKGKGYNGADRRRRRRRNGYRSEEVDLKER